MGNENLDMSREGVAQTDTLASISCLSGLASLAVYKLRFEDLEPKFQMSILRALAGHGILPSKGLY